MFSPPLHPDFAALADFDMGAGFGTPDFDLAGLRAAIASAFPPPDPIAGTRVDRVVLDGRSKVAVDIFSPTASGPHPALIWLHGGGYVMGVALAARDRGIDLGGQLLLYPMLDDRQVTPSSSWNAPVWSRTANEYGWQCYVGDLGVEVPAYAAAARATDLAGLAPAMVVIGGADRFVDEDLDYASRLTHAGVPTDVRVLAGAPHGFDLLVPDSPVSIAAVAEAERWLGERLS